MGDKSPKDKAKNKHQKDNKKLQHLKAVEDQKTKNEKSGPDKGTVKKAG